MSLRRNTALHFLENQSFQPDLMDYNTRYQNNQANSQVFLAHMKQVLDLLKSSLPQGSRLAEVGCGKGDFLELAQADGWFDVSGFDAAYEGDNARIERRFLNSDDRITADIVILRHVLEHIQSPHQFIAQMRDIFSSGLIYIEVPELGWIEQNQTFFDLTYEHVNYFSSTALAALFAQVERAGAVFGGQYQYVIADLALSNTGRFGSGYAAGPWEPVAFSAMFPTLVQRLDVIERSANLARIFIWGAATKGVLFCHHVQRIRPAFFGRIAAAVDINPMKQGHWLPSTCLPILSGSQYCAQAADGDVILVMNPNYAAEIARYLAHETSADIKVHSI
jgi:SAM-dependent methyltransferase